MHIFCQWTNSALEFHQLLLTGYHRGTETPPPGHATLPVTQMREAPLLPRKKSTKSSCTEPPCWASLAHHAPSNLQGVLAVVARDTQESCSRTNNCMQVVHLSRQHLVLQMVFTPVNTQVSSQGAGECLSHCSAPQLAPNGKGFPWYKERLSVTSFQWPSSMSCLGK